MCHPVLVLIAFVLVIVGSLNWGLIAVQPESNGLVAAVFPRKDDNPDEASMGERVVYALVALSALLLVYVCLTKKGASKLSL